MMTRLLAGLAGLCACMGGVLLAMLADYFIENINSSGARAEGAHIAVFADDNHDSRIGLKSTSLYESLQEQRTSPVQAEPVEPVDLVVPVVPMPAGSGAELIAQGYWPLLKTQWSESDERGYRDFVRMIGESNCHNVNACLKGAGNPYRFTDGADMHFFADCADLPYLLRAYYASKNGLPFSYAKAMTPNRGYSRDFRYSFYGNRVVAKTDATTLRGAAPVKTDAFLRQMVNDISSAMYRTDGLQADGFLPDHYSVAINAKAIAPGTVIYDPAGHLAVVYKVERDGRIHFIDSHPDNSLTRGVYGAKFARTAPMRGGGFKKWRPVFLQGASPRADGVYMGGRMLSPRNESLSDYSLEQYYGNGSRPADWAAGKFVINDQEMDYYDYVRAQLAGGRLIYDPLLETTKLVNSLCSDLEYRVFAVREAVAAGMSRRAQPARLPENIYGTSGDWETYSSPSRDARLKVSFKELYDSIENFVRLTDAGSSRISYRGGNIRADLLKSYNRAAKACTITYIRSDGTPQKLSFDDIVNRLFRLSFDPYHCVERRWGASAPSELASCPDGVLKQAWYESEQRLRNQLERTYEVRMDADLNGLRNKRAGTGVDARPEVNARAFLVRALALKGGQAAQASLGKSAANSAPSN